MIKYETLFSEKNKEKLKNTLEVDSVLFTENLDKCVENLEELLKLELKFKNIPTIHNSIELLNTEDREKYYLHIIDTLEIYKKGQSAEIFITIKCVCLLHEEEIIKLQEKIIKELNEIPEIFGV